MDSIETIQSGIETAKTVAANAILDAQRKLNSLEMGVQAYTEVLKRVSDLLQVASILNEQLQTEYKQ